MPQMMPMMWTFILFMSMLFLLFNLMMTYFLFIPKINEKLFLSFSIKKWQWMW